MSDPITHGFQRAKPVYEPAGTSGKTLSVGVAVAIVLAVVVAVVLLLGLAACCIRRWKKKRRTQPPMIPLRGRVPAETAVHHTQASGSGSGTGEQAQGQVTPSSSQETEASSEHFVNVEGCEICCRGYDDAPPEVLDCGHGFHLRCIKRWLKVNLSCPICNTTHIRLCGDTPCDASPPRRRSTSSVDFDLHRSRDDIHLHRSSFRV